MGFGGEFFDCDLGKIGRTGESLPAGLLVQDFFCLNVPQDAWVSYCSEGSRLMGLTYCADVHFLGATGTQFAGFASVVEH